MRRLFWDIETSENVVPAFSAGYRKTINASDIIHERAIICICYKWEGESTVHSLEWTPNKGAWGGCDREMLIEFSKVVEEADELVAHNGDKFDMKWFNTRHLFHKLPPVPESKTVDTLVIARRRFYFNSNRLDYIAKYLGLDGKTKTEKDWWTQILFFHCRKSMKKMVRYCKKDVQLLEQVYHRLSPYHKPKTHVGVQGGSDKWSCPRCGSEEVSKSKTRITASGTVQHQMKCGKCGGYHTISDKAHRDYKEAKKTL